MLAMEIAQHSRPTAPAAVAQMTPRVPSASLAWSGKERMRSKSCMPLGRAIIAGPRSRTVDTIEAPCSGRETGDTNCGAQRGRGHPFMVPLWMHLHCGENRCHHNRRGGLYPHEKVRERLFRCDDYRSRPSPHPPIDSPKPG